MSKSNLEKRIRRIAKSDGVTKEVIFGLKEWGGDYAPSLKFAYRVIRAIWKNRNDVEVDWELKDFKELYYGEEDYLRIPRGEGKLAFLPQIIAFENKDEIPVDRIFADLDSSRGNLLFEPHTDLDWKEHREVKKYLAITSSRWTEVLAKAKANSKCFDGTNCRLLNFRVEEREGEKSLHLICQKVSYFYYMQTNLLLDWKRHKDSVSLRERLLNENQGRLEPLERSPLGNNLGINYLIFTLDGKLIVPQRATEKYVKFRARQFTPSASGTIEPRDLVGEPIDTVAPFWQETELELGISPEMVEGKATFLGITRELIRGGEPELFFFAQVQLDESAIQERILMARENDEILDQNAAFFDFGDFYERPVSSQSERERFCYLFQNFLEEYSDLASIPLLTAMALWFRYKTNCYE